MPSIKISLPHQLPPKVAQARVQKLLSRLQSEHGEHLAGLRETWTDAHGEIAFKYMGFSISGLIDVRPAAVDLELKYPLAGLIFKSKIEAKIKEAAAELLAV